MTLRAATAAARVLVVVVVVALRALAFGAMTLGVLSLGGPLAAAPEEAWAPGLSESEQSLARELLESTVAVAVTQENERPSETAATGAGFVLREDGLVVTSWRTLAGLPKERRVWVRTPGGAWTVAAPLGATWWADVAVLRLVTTRKLGRAVTFGTASVKALGQRFLTVGIPVGRVRLTVATELGGIQWFDPGETTGTAESSRRRPERARPGSTAIALRLPAASWLPTAAGAPVFDRDGGCVGMVVGTDARQEEDQRTVVRTSALVRLAAEAIARDTAFDPANLGVRFGPKPLREGAVEVPEDLRLVREKAKGGALVEAVLPAGPANGRLWEGDVVLAVDGRPLFAEVPASFAAAFLPISPGAIAEVTVFRGGRPQAIRVPTAAARAVDPEFAAAHDAAGAGLR